MRCMFIEVMFLFVVKFVLMPSGQVVTLACTLGQTLRQLKEHFASELKLPYSLILLMHDGKNSTLFYRHILKA